MTRRRCALATVVGVLASVVACGDGESDVAPATSPVEQPSPDTTAAAPPVESVVDEAFLAEQVDRVSIPESGGAFMVAVLDADGVVVSATEGTDPDGNPPTPDSAFRIASITKVFTALVTLSLVDEGLVDLDAPVVDYVTRVPVPADVTVRDLLQHSSGIPEFLDDTSGEAIVAPDPARVWTPEETIGLIAGQEPLFPPGSEWTWSYSSTNYIVLGVLIEEVTGRSFAEVLRTRIIDPLEMENTYLAGFEDGPDPFGAYYSEAPGEPAVPIDVDYTALVTSAWTAGGMVSTADDLHTLFTAVFDGSIVSASSLAEMIENPRQAVISEMGSEFDYGLGMMVSNRIGGRRVEGLVGHGGDLPGYVTLIAHAPDTGMTAFWVTTNNVIDPTPAHAAVAELVAGIR